MVMIGTAFLLGLGGGLHCVGMCGPIALALPLSARTRRALLVQSLWYHLGRILTYAGLGLIFGSLGWGITLAGYQNKLSIFLGLVLILAALFSGLHQSGRFQFRQWSTLWNPIKVRLSRLLQIKGSKATFRIGLLNGLLPCGLVYMALAGALATANWWQGILFMIAFGLGTMPLLLGLMIFGRYSVKNWSLIRSFQPALLLCFGIFLLYRAYITQLPVDLTFWEAVQFSVRCH